MRIAVYENLPPGGALRASYEIGVQLLRRGHEIHLYRLSTYADKGPFDLATRATSVNMVPYEPLLGALDGRLKTGHLAPRSITLFGPLVRLHRRLADQIGAGGYDVVLLHNDAMTYAPYVLRWLKAVPTVYYCQEPPRFVFEEEVRRQHRRNLLDTPYGLGVVRLAEDWLVMGRIAKRDAETASRARVIVVNSVFSRERAWAAYGRSAIVCYLGIDPEVFSPRPEASERRDEVLVVGSPTGAKNYELVLDALSRLPADRRPTLRAVIPTRSSAAWLELAAGEAGVALTIDAGLTERQLVERYRSVMATVCAARLEPFGLTAVESMACGTAVVAVGEGGFRETVVDGVTGLLVDPTAEAMAAAITRLRGDPLLLSEMGAAGRRVVLESWTWQRTGRQMEDILQEAVRG